MWSLRLSVRTLGFHPKKRGSTPLGSSICYVYLKNGCVHQPSVIQCNIGECRLIVELSSAITLTEAETTNHRLSGLSNKRPDIIRTPEILFK